VTTYLVDVSAYNSQGRPFGVGRYAYQLAQAFHGIRGELAADERMLLAVRARGDGLITDDLRIDRHVDPHPPTYGAYGRARRRRLRPALEHAGADLVHFVEGPQTLARFGGPMVVTCHDLIPIMEPAHYLRSRRAVRKRRYRDYRAYWSARRVIAISQATADALAGLLQLPRERIVVVRQGVAHERFHPRAGADERDALTREHRIPARYTLYPGGIDPRKRVDLLVAAQREVFRATGVPLVLVGPGFARPRGSLGRALRDAPPGSVVPLGEVPADRLAALYRHADVHVQPSVYEGFGLTVLEAMACGCPVIVTGGGALGEVADDAARYVARDDRRDLEAAVIDLLQNAGERDRFRTLGIDRAAQFGWDRTARETLVVYRRATGRAFPPVRPV